MPAAPRGFEQETEHQRLHRQLEELLQEVRVAFPGVQVLFAFLLIVPFTQRFVEVTTFQRDVYFATLVFAAVASVLLIAPTAYHRVVFRLHDMQRLVDTANTLALAGLAFLALSMIGAVLLITDVLFGAIVTVVTTVVLSGLLAGLWYLLPMRRARTAGYVPASRRGEA